MMINGQTYDDFKKYSTESAMDYKYLNQARHSLQSKSEFDPKYLMYDIEESILMEKAEL